MTKHFQQHNCRFRDSHIILHLAINILARCYGSIWSRGGGGARRAAAALRSMQFNLLVKWRHTRLSAQALSVCGAGIG